MITIFRYIITGVIGAVVGAGILVLLFVVANPIPSSLTCSLSGENKLVDCVDQDGKEITSPHDVTIR